MGEEVGVGVKVEVGWGVGEGIGADSRIGMEAGVGVDVRVRVGMAGSVGIVSGVGEGTGLWVRCGEGTLKVCGMVDSGREGKEGNVAFATREFADVDSSSGLCSISGRISCVGV